MIPQACRKLISMIIIQLYSKTLHATLKVLENIKCMWTSKVFICSLCYLTIHLLNVSLKRKTNNIFTMMRQREYKSRWSVKTICMAYGAHPHNTRSLNTCIRNIWRAANDDFSLFRHELRHLPSEILDL